MEATFVLPKLSIDSNPFAIAPAAVRPFSHLSLDCVTHSDTPKQDIDTLVKKVKKLAIFLPHHLQTEPLLKNDFVLISSLNEDKYWLYKSLLICKSLSLARDSIFKSNLRGSSGSYIIKDKLGRNLSILKPKDEELGAVNSLNRFASFSKYGINPGDSAIREVLAHHIFPSLIPPTALVKISALHDSSSYVDGKIAAIQKFERKTLTFHELSESEIESIPLSNFSKIALIDLALANADRNRGNLLYNPYEKKLIPIDHGCILPENFASGGHFIWLNYINSDTKFDLNDIRLISEIPGDLPHIFQNQISLKTINSYKFSVSLLKKLCKHFSIKEISYFHMDKKKVKESEFEMPEFSILRSMLKISAFHQTKDFRCTSLMIQEGIMEIVMNEIIDIIETLKKKVLEYLFISTKALSVEHGEKLKNLYTRMIYDILRKFLNYHIRTGNEVIFNSNKWKEDLISEFELALREKKYL
jgi:hypothetical protein